MTEVNEFAERYASRLVVSLDLSQPMVEASGVLVRDVRVRITSVDHGKLRWAFTLSAFPVAGRVADVIRQQSWNAVGLGDPLLQGSHRFGVESDLAGDMVKLEGWGLEEVLNPVAAQSLVRTAEKTDSVIGQALTLMTSPLVAWVVVSAMQVA